MTNVFNEIENLLIDFNPLDECYALNFIKPSDSFALESIIPKNIMNGDVKYCRIDYKNITKGLDPENPDSEYKDRPCVVIFDNDFGKIVMRISSIKKKVKGRILSENEIKKRYGGAYRHIIQDLDSAGLSKPSYAVINEIRRISDLDYMANKTLGNIDSSDFKEILFKLEGFKENRYKVINQLASYLKFVNFAYTHNNKIQTASEIDSSRKVGIADIPNLVHNICGVNLIEHKILWSRLEKNGKYTDHFTCIYHSWNKQKTEIYAFRYFPQFPGHCETKVYKDTTDFDKVANIENNWILDHHPINATNCNSRYLTDDELTIWNMYCHSKRKTDELLSELNNY